MHADSDLENLPLARFGPYAAMSILGEGGMGVVYRARSAENAGEVAIKTIRSRTPRAIDALRAEVDALRRTAHPNIVTILDDGLLDAAPWYAMELVSGQGFDAFNRRLHPGNPEPSPSATATLDTPALPARSGWNPSLVRQELRPAAGGELRRALGIFAGLAAALAHLHRQGILHCDVKPSNVMLSSDLKPKLLDFGLASRFEGPLGGDVAWLNEPGRIAGTLPYLSPERIQGRVIDSRSDLYSLGCMLYETLVGRPPFAANRAREILDCHLHEAPSAPSCFVAGLPEPIEALVLALLAKEPRQRVAYAEDVLERLAPFLPRAREMPPLPSRPAHMLRPALVGREPFVESWLTLAHHAREGSSAVVLLCGESGIGKSFLAAEFGLRAAALGFAIFSGAALPPMGPHSLGANTPGAPLSPLQGFLRAIAERCAETGVAGALPLAGDDLRLLARYEATLALIPGFDALPEPATSCDDLVDDRVLAALERALCLLSNQRPVLLLIDDLQWADRLTQSFCASCARAEHRRRVLVLGTLRHEPALELPEPLRKAKAIHKLVLPLLEPELIRALASDMLGARALPEFLEESLQEYACGNPLLASEYLRSAISAGRLRRANGEWSFERLDTDRASASRRPPRARDDLLIARLAGLSAAGREVLEIAAVLGGEIDPELVQQLAPATDLWRGIAELRERAVFDPRPGNTLRFLHDRLREQSYLAIPAERRVLLHHEIANALEHAAAWSSRRPALLPQIALHWAAAGQGIAAARAFRAAGEHARASGASADAVRYFEQAALQLESVAVAEQGGLAADLEAAWEAAGDLRLLLAEPEVSEVAFQRAEMHASTALERARLRRKRAATRTARQDTSEALSLLESAEHMLAAAPSNPIQRAEWLEIRIERAWTLYWPGRTEELQSVIAETEAHALAHGNALQRLRMVHCSIMADLRQSRYIVRPQTLVKARSALSESATVSSMVERLSAEFSLGFVLLLDEQPDEALPVLENVLRVADHLGYRTRALRAQTYIPVAHRLRNDVEAVRVHSLQLLAQTSAPSAAQYRALALANLGWVALKLDQRAAAEQRLKSALDLWLTSRPSYPLMRFAAWPLLWLAGRGPRPETAREYAAILLRPDQQGLAESLQDALRAVVASNSGRDLQVALHDLFQLSDAPFTR